MSSGKNAGRKRRRRSEADGPERPLRRPPFSFADKSTRVVYIAAEGHRTEGDYVRLLDRVYGRRPGKPAFQLRFCDPGKNGLRPEQVVDLVLTKASAPDDEKWVLFDRDAADHRDAEIPAAMRKAAALGVQVGLSHPSFELWLLLHFQHFTSQENGLDTAVKDRLRKHPAAKGFEKYDTASGERGKGLDEQRGAALLGKEKDAVRNAQKLVDRCPHGSCSHGSATAAPLGQAPRTYEDWAARSGHAPGCDPLRRDPSTDVWRLLIGLDIGTDETDQVRADRAAEAMKANRRRKRP